MQNDEFFGIADLAKRWGFKTISAVRKRRKYDKDFPKPLAKINNNRILVFLKSDIEEYEKLRDGLLNPQMRYTFYRSKDKVRF
jgi:5-formaminoimidazole-4-carboxamide-1-beta-D-ribofuranosyl 5'-monophosphate synthetase